MGKGATSLTNSLYRINDKISQATNKPPLSSAPDVPAQQQNRANQAQQTVVQKKEMAPERIIEFNRMHHDLEIRIEGLISEYQSEIAILEQRAKELNTSTALITKLKQELETIELPDAAEIDPEKTLSKRLRALELMRLESIRVSKKMDSSKGAAAGTAAAQNNESSLMDIPNGDLMKKGFAFFFPLAVILLVCTILLSLAFIFAWKVPV